MTPPFRCPHCKALWLPALSHWSRDRDGLRVWHHDAPYRGQRRRAEHCAYRDGQPLSDPYAPPTGIVDRQRDAAA